MVTKACTPWPTTVCTLRTNNATSRSVALVECISRSMRSPLGSVMMGVPTPLPLMPPCLSDPCPCPCTPRRSPDRIPLWLLLLLLLLWLSWLSWWMSCCTIVIVSSTTMWAWERSEVVSTGTQNCKLFTAGGLPEGLPAIPPS